MNQTTDELSAGLGRTQSRGQTGWAVAGLALLLLYAGWWSTNLSANRLLCGNLTWLPIHHFLGYDFLSPYEATRYWLKGGNPYQDQELYGDPGNRAYIYPPAVFWVFAWGWFVSPSVAVGVWVVALAVMAGIGTIAARRVRQQLGLWPIPLPCALVAILYSTPVLFAMERGNGDLLVLVLIVSAAQALRRRSLGRDLLGGGCLAFAAWIKLYPGLLLLALLATRRWRAALCWALGVSVIGLLTMRELPSFVAVMGSFTKDYDNLTYPVAHSLSMFWRNFWGRTHFDHLAQVSGTLAACVLLLPLALWVSYRMFRCPGRSTLLLPYFLWLTALATFIPVAANDYNLIYLPLAALAVWDRRDPVIVHMMMALLLLWWQPVLLPIGGVLLFGFKLIGLAAVAVSLAGRMKTSASQEDGAGGVSIRAEPVRAGQPSLAGGFLPGRVGAQGQPSLGNGS